jgi:hypothetical protein
MSFNAVKCLEWIFNNLETRKLTKKDAPDEGTFNYLKFLQEEGNQKAKEDFYKNFWSKMLVYSSDSESTEQAFKDDARNLDAFIAKELTKYD